MSIQLHSTLQKIFNHRLLKAVMLFTPVFLGASFGAAILAEPSGWKSAGFDTTGWESANAYTAAQIGVKDGHYGIAWNTAAKLIWASDLKADNTLLCKTTVTGP
jgi:hypothetical protein